MQGSGLNFQQGHYNDPAAGLQTALGAGGMFAQTLKSMQTFDQDEAKLQMMRADRERQAKLDAKAEAADTLAAKRDAYNLGAEKAVNSVQAKDDLANQMFEHGLTNPEQAMLVNQADSQIKASNSGFKVADSLVGVDRTKLSLDKQKRYDELAAADGSLSTKSLDGKDTYNISTKLGLLKDAYSLGGLGDKDAYDKAAASLGISSDTVKGVTASNDEQNAFVNRYSNLAQNDPLFGKSNLDKLTDYESSWAKEHGGDTEFSTTGVQGLRKSLTSANTIAIAEQKKELNDLYAKRALAGETAENKNLDNSIRLAEMRIRAADHETSSEDKLAKALTGVVGGSKLTESDKYSVNLAAHLKQYATSSKPEVGDNIIASYKQAQAKGYSAAEAAAIIQGGIHADGIPEKNAGQAYKFDSQALFKQGPSKTYADNNDYVALRQQQLAGNDAQKEAEFAQLQKLFAAKGGSSTLAALDKQIYDIKRTPQEAFRQASMQAGKDFAYDENLSGHKGIADKQAIAEQAAIEKEYKVPGSTPIASKPASASNIVTGNRMFDLPANIGTVDKATSGKMIRDKSADFIRSREGTKDGIYTVDTLNSDGSVSKIPHIGYGLRIATVAKENGMSVDQFTAGYNNPATRSKFEGLAKASEDNNLTTAYNQANKMAKEAGLTLEAVPVLASTIYNLGPAWADKSNPKGFSKRWELIKQGEFTKAAEGLDKSLWSKQAKGRPQDFVAMLNDQATRKGTKFYTPGFNEISKPSEMSDKEYSDLQKKYKDGVSALPEQIKIQSKIASENGSSFKNETYKHPIDLIQYAYQAKLAEAQVSKLSLQKEYADSTSELSKLKAAAAKIDPSQKVKVNTTADRIEEMQRKMSLMKQKIDTSAGIERYGLPLLN